MGNPKGVKRDFKALEKRRFEAMRLLDHGHNQSETARRLGLIVADCRRLSTRGVDNSILVRVLDDGRVRSLLGTKPFARRGHNKGTSKKRN